MLYCRMKIERRDGNTTKRHFDVGESANVTLSLVDDEGKPQPMPDGERGRLWSLPRFGFIDYQPFPPATSLPNTRQLVVTFTRASNPLSLTGTLVDAGASATKPVSVIGPAVDEAVEVVVLEHGNHMIRVGVNVGGKAPAFPVYVEWSLVAASTRWGDFYLDPTDATIDLFRRNVQSSDGNPHAARWFVDRSFGVGGTGTIQARVWDISNLPIRILGVGEMTVNSPL